MASVQAFAEAEFAPQVQEQLAATYERNRRSIAAMLLDIEPTAVDEAGRQLGSLVLAVIIGTALQWLIEPEATPSASALIAAVSALAMANGPGGSG